ncbi:MAG: Sjogren's syndrome/scleroderma autoantigen 1 family protein [Promethearchaeota archaeon]|jgi:uncharacterized Zn finger protein (UPF0148 family)
MAELLRSGYTMLNIACPICNNPIFRDKKGEKFCPTCNRKVIINDKITIQNKENTLSLDDNALPKKIEYNYTVIKSLIDVINKKIQWITEKLNMETQLDLLEKYTLILSHFYDILKKFSSL